MARCAAVGRGRRASGTGGRGAGAAGDDRGVGLTFIVAWNDYPFARALISPDDLETLPAGMQDLCTSTVTDWGMTTAAGVTSALPALGSFVMVQRYLIAGSSAGAAKG